ncbi:alkaline ceramidase 2-like [Branchiostoma floridae]|uniref:Alkaline ceramidase n=1 Tax=Branchiostoma floridae TaxID=7739 RepID=C3Y1U1_BRAFL|nr:alkaline ceramidase 2-like [Branchiostoma floridae]|eukprot:XP_002609821.1 hypothetical protein BRAFLDRAFT_280354 [Branchiostoma floridae]
MLKEFERGSSDVDWCEANYDIVPAIAEFWNTISNFLFIVLPPVLMYLFRPYARQVNASINLIWWMLAVVGISSAYFHATLSLVGQLLDEIAILWVIIAAWGVWAPRRFFPRFCNESRKSFMLLMLGAGAITTILAFLHPSMNHFLLMPLAIPSLMCMFSELKRCNDWRVIRLGIAAFVWFSLALTCWLNDRLFCHIWESVSFPYLHSGWHIFIAIASFELCVVMAYFEAVTMAPERAPTLKFWPYDRCDLGVPYVSFKCSAAKPIKEC